MVSAYPRVDSVKAIPQFLAFCLVAACCCAPLLAHEDDPKLLDRQAPYVGPGYRPGAFLPGGSQQPNQPTNQTPTGFEAALAGMDDSHLLFPSNGVELVAWMPLAELSSGAYTANDCWGYVSGSGKEYAIIGLSDGTAFVDISSPSDPVLVSHLAGPSSLWRDIKTYGDYAYIVSEGGSGIQVVRLDQIDSGQVNHVNTISSGGTSSTHNVAIDEDSGYLYRCGGASGQGLRIYSLSNPSSPSYVGSWNTRYVHDVQVVTYSEGPYAGRQIAFACSGFGNGSVQTGLTILDVTNKSNIQVRAQLYYSDAAYSHQAWLSADRQTLYLNDELDEDGSLPTTTHRIDVSDLDNPVALGTFTNGSQAIGHNLYTNGDKLYEANYRSGLRIFDTSSNPTEIAFFDTWPADDSNHFNGLWSTYPYFPSGIVIGSDLERGLFLWWVGDPKLSFDLVGGAPTLLAPSGDSVSVLINELSAGDLQAGSESLFYDTGSGWTEAPLTALGAGAYTANFPAVACGQIVQWFVSARSTDGLRWSYPKEAPYSSFESLAALGEQLAWNDPMEADTGWQSFTFGDTAHPTSRWVRATPLPDQMGASDTDHSPQGTKCWLTGENNDLDGGFTTLTSPAFNVEGWANPLLDTWVWFERRGFADVDGLRIEASEDGLNWILIERIQSLPIELSGRWLHLRYELNQWIAPGAQTKVRFRARDGDLDSLMEVMIDDFKILEPICACGTYGYCTSTSNSVSSGALISSIGSTQVAQNNLTLQISGGVPGNLGLFFYGPDSVQIPLADGFLCAGGGQVGIQRLQPPLAVDALGQASRWVDLTAPPADVGAGAIQPGSTWSFQFWYRDPQGGPSGSNLSNGLRVTFCP